MDSRLCAPPLNFGIIRLSRMKYKVLKSIAHNFSHSFVGYTNYFDDGHVVDDLVQLARKTKASELAFTGSQNLRSKIIGHHEFSKA